MNRCPCCLKANEKSYCLKCRKRLFNGKEVNHILSFTRPEFNTLKRERSGRLSISGVQIKHSLKLEENKLVLTEKDGEYILKPIPSSDFENVQSIPANEHITMQIANQVFNISTAENVLIFFADDEMAYITRRFDVLVNSERLLQEDFAQIANRSSQTHGLNYKYDYSYEGIAKLMKKYVATYDIEIEKFFKLILFNFLISNGDAHLKNFSLYKNQEYGDYLLTPSYDLINSSLHVPNERDTALELFDGDFMTKGFMHSSKYTKDDFIEFGSKIGLADKRIEKQLEEITSHVEDIEELIKRSFLENQIADKYLEKVKEKRERLQYSFSNDQ